MTNKLYGNFGLVSIALLTAGCVQTASIDQKISAPLRTACSTSNNLLSEGFGLGDLPGITTIGATDAGLSRGLSLTEFSRLQHANESLESELIELNNRQAAGKISKKFKFGLGMSSETIAGPSNRRVTRHRDRHAMQAKIVATGEILSQTDRDKFRQKSDNTSTTLTEDRAGAGTLFGIIPLRTKESFKDGRYTYAALLAWSPDIELSFRGVALGCLGQENRSSILSDAEIRQTVKSALSNIPGRGVPSGGRKLLFSDGTLGYLGFGVFPMGQNAVDAQKALEVAELISKTNALREVFSEFLVQSNFRTVMTISEGDFQTTSNLSEKFKNSIQGLRVPGLKKYGEMVIRDPISSERLILIVSGLFPQKSIRTATSLRNIINDRFKNEAISLNVN